MIKMIDIFQIVFQKVHVHFGHEHVCDVKMSQTIRTSSVIVLIVAVL